MGELRVHLPTQVPQNRRNKERLIEGHFTTSTTTLPSYRTGSGNKPVRHCRLGPGSRCHSLPVCTYIYIHPFDRGPTTTTSVRPTGRFLDFPHVTRLVHYPSLLEIRTGLFINYELIVRLWTWCAHFAAGTSADPTGVRFNWCAPPRQRNARRSRASELPNFLELSFSLPLEIEIEIENL